MTEKILRKWIQQLLLIFSGLVTTTVLNTKIDEVDNKIPGVSGLVEKTYYNVKLSDIEAKYFTGPGYNK